MSTENNQKDTECMVYDTLVKEGKMNLPTDLEDEQTSQLYTSNGSVAPEVIARMLTELLPYQERFKSIMLKDKEEAKEKRRVIAVVLTQKTAIFVRHDGFLYVYDDRIYRKVGGCTEVCGILRELCENAGRVIPHLDCSAKSVKEIYAEIEQTAKTVDYPPDIAKLIAFRNGILNLDTMKLEEFSPGRFITSMIDVNWTGQKKDCLNFDEMIDTYVQDDEPLKERLLQVLCVCITNEIVKKIFCFLGVSHSGKSFLVNFLLSLYAGEGDAFHVLQPNDFQRQFSTSMIHGKSIITCMDMEETSLNPRVAATLKSISGHDRINFELKHKNGGHPFMSRAHVVLCSNYDIMTKKEDAAFRKRKLVIPFEHQFMGDEVQPEELMKQLEGEKEAIVYKLVQTFLELRKNQFKFSGGKEHDSYVPKNDTLVTEEASFQAFYREMVEETSSDKEYVFLSDLYKAYQEFEKEYDVFRFSGENAFAKCAKRFLDQKHERKRREDGNGNPQSCYLGIRLKSI